MKDKVLPWVITLIALGLSSTAAYYSVIGLSKLFAGVATAVIIMASFLEASKLVIASLLFQYWKTINKLLKIYLISALVTLVIITSAGIYGMLSGGYQETYSKLSLVENQKSFTQQKIDFYQTDINQYDKEIERISNNISTLSNAKVSTIQVQDTTVSGGVRSTISTTEIRMAQNRINVEEENRKFTQEKRIIATDSLQKYQLEVLNLDNNNDIAGELGPLQYLSSLTGYPMDKIINILLLVIIFVFDPLALSLVVAANFSFEQAYPKKKYRENLYEEQVEITPFEESDEWGGGSIKNNFDSNIAESRMNIISQKGNEEEHYSQIKELDLDGDGIISKNEYHIALQSLNKLKNQMGGDLKSDSDMGREAAKLERLIKLFKESDDSLTKIY